MQLLSRDQEGHPLTNSPVVESSRLNFFHFVVCNIELNTIFIIVNRITKYVHVSILVFQPVTCKKSKRKKRDMY
jgi:hypothetical protein